MSDWASSPFIVPIGAFAAWFGVVAVRAASSYKMRKLRSQERLAAIEKGIPLPDLAEDISACDYRRPPSDPAQRVARLRTGGIVCSALGLGLVLFFVMLAHVLDVRPILAGAAAGLIPLAIGVGLLIDARLQAAPPAAKPAEAPAAPPTDLPPQQ